VGAQVRQDQGRPDFGWHPGRSSHQPECPQQTAGESSRVPGVPGVLWAWFINAFCCLDSNIYEILIILISSHLTPEANLISFSASRFCRQMARKQFHMQTPGIWQQQLAQNTLRLRQPHR